MTWNVASLWSLYKTHGGLSGILANAANRLPSMLLQDSATVALFSCLTGVLDCFSGQVCITFGINKQATQIEIPGSLLVFKNTFNRDAYFGVLQDAANSGKLIPSWPLTSWEDYLYATRGILQQPQPHPSQQPVVLVTSSETTMPERSTRKRSRSQEKDDAKGEEDGEGNELGPAQKKARVTLEKGHS
jgi:hypothetical protein